MPRWTSARVSGGLPGVTMPIVEPGGAARATEDSTPRPYVCYRYAICGAEHVQMFPVAAQDLLRGKGAVFDIEWTRQGAECFDVTTEEARTLDAILADAGFLSRGNGRWIPIARIQNL